MTVWLLLCGTVHAAGGTLTLRYAFDGVAFSIYRVAEPTAAGYALTGPFDDCRVRLPRRSGSCLGAAPASRRP